MNRSLLTYTLFLAILFFVACSGGGEQQDGNNGGQNQQEAKEPSNAGQKTNPDGDNSTTSGGTPGNGQATESREAKGNQVRSGTEEKIAQQQASSSKGANQSSSDSLNFILQGEVKGGARSEVILDKLGIGGDSRALASTTVNKGDRFKFGGKIPRPGLYSLRFPSDQIVVALQEGVQRIQVDFADLDDYTAEGAGAKGTMYMLESFKLLNKYNRKGDSLRKVAENTENNSKRIRLYKKIQERQKRWNKEKLKETKALLKRVMEDNSIAAPAIAVRAQVQKDMAFFEKLHKHYKDQYPENYFVKKLGEKLENARAYLKKQNQ